MNHIYHSIWNEALGTWIAVSEIATGQGKRPSNHRKLLATGLLICSTHFSAAQVNVADSAKISTKAAHGKTGTWIIDPTDYTIAATGGNMTGAALSTSLNSTAVTILSTAGTSGVNGDVNVNDAVNWSANLLTLNAVRNININANLNGSGAAQLALQYGQGAIAAGNTSTYSVKAAVNLPAGNNFSTKSGSDGVVKNYTVITSLGAQNSTTTTDLQGMNGGLGLNYVLGANIDASATSAWTGGFKPVGNGSPYFTGNFDGLGHTITGLTISRPTTNFVGLFGRVDGSSSSISNVGLVGGSIVGQNYVGGLAGVNGSGTINNAFWDTQSTGQVTGVGLNSGTLTNVLGRTTAQMRQASTFSAWSISNTGGSSAVWRIYEGNTASLLRSFLTVLTVNSSKTYNGLTDSGTATYTNTLTGATVTPNANLLGTASTAKNAGSYAITGLYSNQPGYDISLGSLTINPATLTITANADSKTYNGLAYSGGNGVSYAGFVNGETNTVLGGTLAYGGNSQGAINAGSYLITPSGLTSGNYTITYNNGALTVRAAPLTITAQGLSSNDDAIHVDGVSVINENPIIPSVNANNTSAERVRYPDNLQEQLVPLQVATTFVGENGRKTKDHDSEQRHYQSRTWLEIENGGIRLP